MELTQEQINDIVEAVFSLMESQGMLPDSQLDVIAQNVKRRLKLDSTGVDEVPVVDSIDGVNSLPCVRQSGSVFDIVRAPLHLLKGKLASMPIFRISSGYWQVSENDGSTWRDVLDQSGNRVSGLGKKGDKGDPGTKGDPGDAGEKGEKGEKGDPGESVTLRATETEIQWRLGDGDWKLLIELSQIGGSSTLGGMTNVSPDSDTAEDGAVLIYDGNEWKPATGAFIPTGVAEDESVITTFDDLMSYISSHGGGGGGGGGIQYYLRILNNLSSKTLFTSKGEPCYINFTFVSQQRDSSDVPFTDTNERGYCQVFARNGQNEYKEVLNTYINSSKETQIDVSSYLMSGGNNIMIKITGEETAMATPTLVYNVQLTSLSLSSNNFQWWSAFASDIIIPMNIGGNISKILHVDIKGNDYTESYDIKLGTNIYTETAYNYSLPHPGKTGVFNVSFFVQNSDGNVRTRTLSYNLICILPGATDKLIAVNNRIEKAVNWSENILFDYTMYDGGKVSTSAKFVVTKDVENVYVSENDAITTSSKQTLSIPLEIETMDNADFNIITKVFDNDTEMTSISFPVDNSAGYSANAGAVFYLNPRTRSNNQSNRQSIINEMTGESLSATWNRINWGVDGWTTDAIGNRVLRLISGSSVVIDYKPFSVESARTGKTIEIDYKVDNVTDFTKEILTIASAASSFVGLKIYPDNLIMHSQSLKNGDFQSLNLRDGERIRMTLTIMPDAYGNAGFNLCAIYINGRKNREFTYKNNDYFAHNGNIVIGSNHADVDIYGIRIYDSALTSGGILRNYINWLVNNSQKEQESSYNDVMDANGSEIDFENVKAQFNVFVFDNTFPRLSNPNKYKGTLTVFFAGHPELDKTLPDVEAKGQGTSSMRYWWWNIRFTLSSGSWQLVPGIPAGTKFTAKKNFASSMHSHKMGSVDSFHDLFKAMGLSNEAMRTEEYANARVAVYQEPFVGFEKSVNEEGEVIYTFMGLYTMGPDKGDKNTFGYNTSMFPGLISIEGSDNAPLAALFRVPWNETTNRIIYSPDEEAWQYNGVNSWDFDGGKEENISKWIPAYNLVYQCSPRLKPFDGTLDELNAQIATYRNEQYEFWIAEIGDINRYNVYYFEATEGKFIPSDIGAGPINLLSQLVDKGYGLTSSDLSDKTIDELNTLFQNARIAKFRAEAATYFDIDDSIYHRNWVEFHAATDNRAKNTYPYSFGTETSKWKWRGDDFDTIFDIDNQGQAKKGYSVETHDTYINGAPVWNGETSNFWNLIDLAFPNEVIAGMRMMMMQMEELGGLNNGDDFDKLYAYFDKYYFSKAQKYFCTNLYNADAKFTYENAKIAYIDGRYTNDTDPMTQALGDHFSAEQRWVMKRIIYMMSKYSFGTFSADGTDNITVRAAGDTVKYELTPAMDLYPAIANGTSIIRGARTKAGEICSMDIDLSGTGDQQNAIQGASYLQDIGDWYDKNVTGAMIVQGKRLREVRLGSKTEPIVISITSLTISNCVSLQKLVLSQIDTLTGSLNLSACTHLKEVYADGTGLTQIVLPKGGGLEKIEYGSNNQYIYLQNFPSLTNEGVIIDTCRQNVTDFLISECENVNPISILSTVFNSQTMSPKVLKRIRCTGFDVDSSDNVIDMLLSLTDGSYNGLDADGVVTSGLPVFEGKIHVSSIMEETLSILNNAFNTLEIQYDHLQVTPTRTIIVTEDGTSERIPNATVNINGQDFITDENGQVVIKTGAKLVVAISADGYASTELSCSASSSNRIYTVLLNKIVNLTVQVCDRDLYLGIANAQVTFNGETKLTDELGFAVFKTIKGRYNCEANYKGETQTGIVNVQNADQTFYLHFDLNIEVFKPAPNGNIQMLLYSVNKSDIVRLSITSPDTEYEIDWGDGIIEPAKGIGNQQYEHNYGSEYRQVYNAEIRHCENVTFANTVRIAARIASYIYAYWSIGNSQVKELSFYNGMGSSHEIRYIGADIFQNDTNRKSFKDVFYGCSFQSIPEGLFDTCVKATNFNNCFYNSKIKSCPEGLFDNIPDIKDFSSCFERCYYLQSAVIPKNITNLGSNTYSYCGLKWLKTTLETPQTIGDKCFYNTDNCPIYVPDSAVEVYKTATNWVSYADRIKPMSQFAIDFPEDA